MAVGCDYCRSVSSFFCRCFASSVQCCHAYTENVIVATQKCTEACKMVDWVNWLTRKSLKLNETKTNVTFCNGATKTIENGDESRATLIGWIDHFSVDWKKSVKSIQQYSSLFKTPSSDTFQWDLDSREIFYRTAENKFVISRTQKASFPLISDLLIINLRKEV